MGPKSPSAFERFVAPYPLIAGVVLSFLLCCAGGHLASHWNCFSEFIRFHRYTSTETQFFPTACQLHELAHVRLTPDRIAVVVGGNSILRGVGQPSSHVWTRELQQRLGDRYVVLNFAMNGACLAEFGGTAAEMILQEHPRVVFISNTNVAGQWGELDGCVYPYLFWDAYFKQLVPHTDERDAGVVQLARQRKGDEPFGELQRQMFLDRWVYARDLWTTVAYTTVSTAWNQALGSTFWKPRRKYYDPEDVPPPPVEARFRPDLDAVELRIIRTWIAQGQSQFVHPTPETRASLAQRLKLYLSETLRSRTLLLAVEECPYYLKQLTADEQRDYHQAFNATVCFLREQGVAAQVSGRGFAHQDYYDRCHLSESGGRRLAEETAAAVCALAERLGYLDGP